MRPTDFRLPRVTRPVNRDELDTRMHWHPYPKTGPEISFSPQGILDERINLYEIACHIPNLLLTSTAKGTPPAETSSFARSDNHARLQNIQSQLRKWHSDLPDYARYDSESSGPVAPPVIDTL